MNVVVGGSFTDPGASTNEGTLSTSGTVNVNSVGTYTITYTATDATGNTGTATRTVAVYKSQFSYTGSAQTFTVPAGVTSISVDAYGGSDYCALAGWSLPGKGVRVECDLVVTPGQVLNIYVGDHGGQPLGGWNGGGRGSNTSSGGGGATDIRIGGTNLTDRVIVSGAAGERGHGGGLVGGYPHKNWGMTPGLGSPGTQTSGGAGGGFYGTSAGSGTLGIGGDYGDWSGSGAGCYYGGGGGKANSAGGGSSYTHPSLCSSVVHTQGVRSGSGQLLISLFLVEEGSGISKGH